MLLPTASWTGCQPARVKSGLPIKWQFWLAPSNFFFFFLGGGQKKTGGPPPPPPPCITPMPMYALCPKFWEIKIIFYPHKILGALPFFLLGGSTELVGGFYKLCCGIGGTYSISLHFDIPKKNCSPKIEKYAVSKVDLPPLL
jgi:hypothetical protein